MATTTFNAYTTKLQGIAANHKLLQHTEQKKHFATVCTAAFVNEFGSVNIDEVLNGVRSSLLSPCLIADLPLIKTDDPKGEDRKKEFAGAFLVLKKTALKGLTAQAADIDECTGIAENVLGWLDELYLRAQEDGTAAQEWAINFEEVEIVPIAKLKDDWVGVRVNLPFRIESEVAFQYDESAFLNPLD
jgi:hypothetical protein